MVYFHHIGPWRQNPLLWLVQLIAWRLFDAIPLLEHLNLWRRMSIWPLGQSSMIFNGIQSFSVKKMRHPFFTSRSMANLSVWMSTMNEWYLIFLFLSYPQMHVAGTWTTPTVHYKVLRTRTCIPPTRTVYGRLSPRSSTASPLTSHTSNWKATM